MNIQPPKFKKEISSNPVFKDYPERKSEKYDFKITSEEAELLLRYPKHIDDDLYGITVLCKDIKWDEPGEWGGVTWNKLIDNPAIIKEMVKVWGQLKHCGRLGNVNAVSKEKVFMKFYDTEEIEIVDGMVICIENKLEIPQREDLDFLSSNLKTFEVALDSYDKVSKDDIELFEKEILKLWEMHKEEHMPSKSDLEHDIEHEVLNKLMIKTGEYYEFNLEGNETDVISEWMSEIVGYIDDGSLDVMDISFNTVSRKYECSWNLDRYEEAFKLVDKLNTTYMSNFYKLRFLKENIDEKEASKHGKIVAVGTHNNRETYWLMYEEDLNAYYSAKLIVDLTIETEREKYGELWNKEDYIICPSYHAYLDQKYFDNYGEDDYDEEMKKKIWEDKKLTYRDTFYDMNFINKDIDTKELYDDWVISWIYTIWNSINSAFYWDMLEEDFNIALKEGKILDLDDPEVYEAYTKFNHSEWNASNYVINPMWVRKKRLEINNKTF